MTTLKDYRATDAAAGAGTPKVSLPKGLPNRLARFALVAALLGVVATSAGCFRRVPIENATNTHTTSKRIAAGDAKSVATRISFGAGELTLEGSDTASDAVVGDFAYAPKTLEPEVASNVEGDVLRAAVRQPDATNVPPMYLGGPVNIVAKWDVKLTDALPTELTLSMGAGEADVDLSRVNITDLEMNLGAGETTIDLTGPRTGEVDGRIWAGAGEITIRLPKDVPVRVVGRQDGIGSWRYDDGFTADGNAVVNDAWRESDGSAGGRIELNVQRAVGEVRLELAD